MEGDEIVKELKLAGGLASLLAFRQKYSAELFEEKQSASTVRVFMPYNNGSWLYCDVSDADPTYLAIQPTIEQAFPVGVERIHSHNYADSSTWAEQDPLNSIFSFTPPLWTLPGVGDVPTRIVAFKVIVRFPASAVFNSGNGAFFKLYRSLDGVTPVDETTSPSLNKQYPSTRDMVMDSEIAPIIIPAIPGIFTNDMVHLEFKFHRQDTLIGKGLVMKGNLNERLDVGFSANQQIKDKDGVDLDDPCEVILVCDKTTLF